MIENKRFKLLYSQLDNGMFVDREKQFEDIIVDKEFQKIGLIKLVDLLNKLADENEKLKKDCSNLIDDNTEYVSEMNHIKQVIKEAYNNERTQLGKSVLKQLLNNIGEI